MKITRITRISNYNDRDFLLLEDRTTTPMTQPISSKYRLVPIDPKKIKEGEELSTIQKMLYDHKDVVLSPQIVNNISVLDYQEMAPNYQKNIAKAEINSNNKTIDNLKIKRNLAFLGIGFNAFCGGATWYAMAHETMKMDAGILVTVGLTTAIGFLINTVESSTKNIRNLREYNTSYLMNATGLTRDFNAKKKIKK